MCDWSDLDISHRSWVECQLASKGAGKQVSGCSEVCNL